MILSEESNKSSLTLQLCSGKWTLVDIINRENKGKAPKCSVALFSFLITQLKGLSLGEFSILNTQETFQSNTAASIFYEVNSSRDDWLSCTVSTPLSHRMCINSACIFDLGKEFFCFRMSRSYASSSELISIDKF